MRLYLAVAVLMLAFVAYTEAQEDTLQERLTRFTEQIAEISRNLAEKAKTTFQQIHESEVTQTSKNWLQERLEELKAKFGGQ